MSVSVMSVMASLESFFETLSKAIIIFIFSPVAHQCCWEEGAAPQWDLACTSHFPGTRKIVKKSIGDWTVWTSNGFYLNKCHRYKAQRPCLDVYNVSRVRIGNRGPAASFVNYLTV